MPLERTQRRKGWIYAGYKMTIFSTAEEQQREPLEIGGKVLFYPDFALRTAGGDVSVLAPWIELRPSRSRADLRSEPVL